MIAQAARSCTAIAWPRRRSRCLGPRSTRASGPSRACSPIDRGKPALCDERGCLRQLFALAAADGAPLRALGPGAAMEAQQIFQDWADGLPPAQRRVMAGVVELAGQLP